MRRHFYIRELVEEMRIVVPHVKTADNIADFFTKSLTPKVFFPMRDIIMNVPAASRAPVSIPKGTLAARAALASASRTRD